MQSLIVIGLTVAACFCNNQDDEIKAASFDDLRIDARSLDQVELESLPLRIAALDGKTIRIRGFIHGPSMTSPTESEFMLVRDALEFSPWPECNNIAVTLVRDTQVDYTARPVTVVGTFKVTERRRFPNSDLTTFYQLSDAKVVTP